MLIQPFFVSGLAHCSYLLAGSKSCAVIDPRRDVRVYLDAANSLGVKITHILETHLHADFVSGHMDLAEKTGAAIHAPRSARCAFEHVGLADGDVFNIEDMEVRVLETPGHTPEHIVYVVADRTRGEEPAALFSGDTLFVGDVGRPDLFPGIAEELAGQLHDSLYRKLMGLPDFCEVYPAHGAGSLCGRDISAKRTSAIGYEKRYNYALRIPDRKEFIRRLTTGMPAAPDHFSRCSETNRKGPARIGSLPGAVPLDPLSFARRAESAGAAVLDIRPYDAFGGQHVMGSYHIDLTSNFSTFAGWILPPEAEILLVADHRDQVERASVLLRRVGLDRVTGYLEGGSFAWAVSGFPLGHVPQLSAQELTERICGGEPVVLLDVRSVSEFEGGHIEGAVHIPVSDLKARHGELDREASIVAICNVGQRGTLAASLLKQRGFRRISNLAGGMTAYNAATGGAECPVCALPHGPALSEKSGGK
jgi:hydroxyacylglutathione hydrolase